MLFLHKLNNNIFRHKINVIEKRIFVIICLQTIFGVWVVLLVVLAFKIYQDLSYDKKYQNPLFVLYELKTTTCIWLKFLKSFLGESKSRETIKL